MLIQGKLLKWHKPLSDWLESNHSSIDYIIFYTYENADYEIYKALNVHCLLSCVRIPFDYIYMKENSNTDYVVNVEIVEISN